MEKGECLQQEKISSHMFQKWRGCGSIYYSKSQISTNGGSKTNWRIMPSGGKDQMSADIVSMWSKSLIKSF